MKRIILTVTLILVGMAIIAPISAQDMSYYNTQYMLADGTFADRLLILEIMQKEGVQGTPEFYHNALKFLLVRVPDMDWGSKNERAAAEKSVVILAQALGKAKVTAAATDLWQAAEYFDVVREQPYTPNEAHAQQAALIALGDVDGKAYLPHVVQRLTDFNTQTYKQTETRKRVQVAVIGCIKALETFKDISGYRPVFFALNGGYDKAVKDAATHALPLIADDPSDVIIEIIRDPSVTPPVKLVAWTELERTKAPNASKAKVAAVALEIGWLYQTSNKPWQTNLRQLRKNAITVIRQHGVAGDNVYIDLEKSYSNNFISNQPDNDEIAGALNALAAIKTDESNALLHKFLEELHARRRAGPWRNKERQMFEWVVACIGASGTKNLQTRLLLTTIRNSDYYTGQEKNMAIKALEQIGN